MMKDRSFRWPVLLVSFALLAVLVSRALPQQVDFFGQQPGGGSLAGGAGQDVVAVAAGGTVAAGANTGELAVTATIEPGWHIYSITQPPGGPIASNIKLQSPAGVRLAGQFHPSPPPEKKPEPAFDNLMVEVHHGTVRWRAPIELPSGIDPATLEIRGTLTVQPCSANSCLPPRDLPFTAALTTVAQAPSPPPAPSPLAPPDQPAAAQPPEPLGFDPGALVIAENEQIKRFPLWLAALMGLAGGLILNLMPCVLPVIGLKILSFVEQSGHSRGRALLLNVWYSLGLMSVFLLLATLAVFAGFGWGQLFSYQAFNITLAAVVFVMGLSFLGVWEIPIPGFVGSGKAVEMTEQEGAVGAFSKGVLTTILATPCSAPFLAPALTWAVAQPPLETYTVFASVGLGMASPYLLIGAFPGLIRFLPKPGMWMETFKQIMGFVLMGTVVFLLTFIPWTYRLPTIGLLFGLWASCWWIGRSAATADLPGKVRTWLEAAAFAGVVWIAMFPGLDEIIPKMPVGGLHDVMKHRFRETIQRELALLTGGSVRQGATGSAVTPQSDPPGDPNSINPTPGSANAPAVPESQQSAYRLPWRPFTRAAFEDAVRSQNTVLIDFTADWCLTCKTLETGVLNTSKVRQLVDANRVVTFHADWTHADPEVTEMLNLLGSKQVPVLAIFPAGDPNRPIVLRGGFTRQTLLDALQQAGPSN